jgi:sulfate-transporting ATPase
VGIIGPNGAGKTTLFRMIMGEEKPDSGTITLGDTVQLAYVDQSHKDLLPEKTVYEVVSGGLENMAIGGTLGEQPRLPGPLQLHRHRPEQEGGRALRW